MAAAATTILLAGAAAGAEPEAYAIDPVHTRVVLAVDHAGFSKAIGTVSGSTGTLAFDPEDWTTATLRAEVPLARLDFGDARWNAATLGNNLLDAEDHPVVTFVSTRIEPVDTRHAMVYGDLTVRGVTREVKLDVTLNAHKRHPLPPFRRTVGFSASTELSRADFGMTAWKSVIGDRVELRIEAEATRTRRSDATGDDDAPPAQDRPATDPTIPEQPVPDPPPPDVVPESATEATGETTTDPAQAPVDPAADDPESTATEPPPAAESTPWR